MNTPSSFDDSLVYVHIDSWEYQCCGTVPRVGAELSGTLTVHESGIPRYLAPPVSGFDPHSGLVRFGAAVAQLGSGLTEPVGNLVLVLSRHGHSAKPRLTGTVGEVVEKTGRFLPLGDERSLRIDPESYGFRVVDEAPRWPEEQLIGGGTAAPGVIVGLRVSAVSVPTEAEIEERLLWEDRVRRTVRAIMPAAMFAARAPVVGDRLELDLADPAVRAFGDHVDSSATVHGEIAEVSPLPELPEGAGWVALTPLTVEGTANYLIDLVRDPE